MFKVECKSHPRTNSRVSLGAVELCCFEKISWARMVKILVRYWLRIRSKGFSNRDMTILSINKTQKYLRYWVQIYCGYSASITFYEWNSISVIWPPRARLQRSILWTQFSTTLAHISTGTLTISRWMLSLRSTKVAGLLS